MGTLVAAQDRILLPNRTPYYQRVRSVETSSLIGYWPLWEPSGAVAEDLSPEKNNGAYTAVTLRAAGIGDGRTAGSFDGSTSYCNIYSAGLNTDFNGQEFTVLLWARVNAASVWTDASDRRLITLMVDSNNLISIRKTATANQLLWFYKAGGVQFGPASTAYATTDWLVLAMTASKSGDQFKIFAQGAQVGSTSTGLGLWSGSLLSTQALIGAYSTTPDQLWHGSIAHVALWKKALSPAQIQFLSRR